MAHLNGGPTTNFHHYVGRLLAASPGWLDVDVEVENVGGSVAMVVADAGPPMVVGAGTFEQTPVESTVECAVDGSGTFEWTGIFVFYDPVLS